MKAYDKMKRNFLGSMMIKLGFHINYVDKIMTCVQFILVNGSPSKSFTHNIGIKKGNYFPFSVSIMCSRFVCIVTKVTNRKEN